MAAGRWKKIKEIERLVGHALIVFIPGLRFSTQSAKAETFPLLVDPRPRAHRRPGLDLLRAFAIISVVAYHAGLFGFTLPFRVDRYGWIGVDLFFVLSGYLIGGQLLASISRHGQIDLPTFYFRRALRI